MGSDLETRIRHVTAVLGPTNTGKTHLAIERMIGHESGMIGLPLRLLAREVYDKIAARVGADAVALITGEEKIKPERARYWVCTVEAMPRDVDVDFLAIDEVQLAGDPERGHVFTNRLLHARGRSETLLLGAQTMREAIGDLIPGANFISRPRLSKLSYAGQKKITRLPQRTAVVAFSAADVYSIAELIRRQRGGAAVVLGALSPRTRNAQVALYQSGDVDFLVATDAVGMGLNLDVDHVAFSAARKFDGQGYRNLTPAELSQIAGRAGRHMNDGTFGVTGSAEPFDSDTIERLETHNFEPVRMLQWRNRDLDFSTLEGLKASLRETPRLQRLTRARAADDVLALETVGADKEIIGLACAPAAVAKLWDVCQVPDYRKISGQSHAELVATIYKFIVGSEEHIPEDWFAKQVAFADRTDGDIDTLANRIAHIRTWTFVSNRADWLKDPGHWQEKTREVEDKLSDALHECLTERFVDLRTSALMKGMRDKDELQADIKEDGSIHVENHYVGRLKGFCFAPDQGGEGIHGKATRNAAAQVLARELSMRARRVAAAQPDAFHLTQKGSLLWKEEEIARLEATEDPLKLSVAILADEHLSAPDRDKVQARLEAWIAQTIADKLKPLVEIGKAEDVSGLARGIAFRLRENLGILKRETIADEIKALDQTARAQLRKYGVRFGAFNIYFPLLLKPAAAEIALTLWTLRQAGANALSLEFVAGGPARRAHLVRAGSGRARGLLSRLRLSRVRAARRADRHSGAPCRPDPSAARLARERGGCAAPAQGGDGRRRFHGDARDDVAPGLLARRAERRPDGAGLPPRPTAGAASGASGRGSGHPVRERQRRCCSGRYGSTAFGNVVRRGSYGRRCSGPLSRRGGGGGCCRAGAGARAAVRGDMAPAASFPRRAPQGRRQAAPASGLCAPFGANRAGPALKRRGCRQACGRGARGAQRGRPPGQGSRRARRPRGAHAALQGSRSAPPRGASQGGSPFRCAAAPDRHRGGFPVRGSGGPARGAGKAR